MAPQGRQDDIGNVPAVRAAVASRGQDAASSSALTGRALLPGGREFACTALNVTVAAAEIVAEIRAEAGQAVVCHLENLGIFPGKVVRATDRGFIMALHLAEAQRERIAGRLEWHTNQVARTAELRAARRIVPVHQSVEVRLGERIVLQGRILNISISGAAIELGAQPLPFMGARVRIGGRFASVVRLLEAGIGVQFDEPFMPEHFDERVRP